VRSKKAVAVHAVLGAFLCAPPAFATPTSTLTYVRSSGAESCPDEPELRRAVAKRVGYDPFFRWAERTVVAQIDPVGRKGFSAKIHIVDTKGALLGERALDPVADCRELVQNVALAISVAIGDLDAARPAAPPTEPPAPVAEPVTSLDGREELAAPPATPPPDRGLEAQPSERRRWRARTALGVVGALGTAPAPAAGIAIGLGLRTSWFQLGLDGRADLPASKSLGQNGRAASSLVLASLVPCAVARRRLSPFACALASVGRFAASAEDVPAPASASALYVGLGGRTGVEIQVAEGLAMVGQIDIGATLTRHRLEVGSTNVFTLPLVWGTASVGAAAYF
jgi:hypothetical protein